MPELRRRAAIAAKLRWLLGLAATFRDDLRCSAGLPPLPALRAWRLGFKRSSFRLFGLDRGARPGDYLSDLHLLRTEAINRRYRAVFDDKVFAHTVMLLYGMPVPELYGVIRAGRMYMFDSPASGPAAEVLEGLARKAGRVVVKPRWGYHGFGFLDLAHGPDGLRINGAAAGDGAAARLLSGLDASIVCGYVRQGAYAAALFPGTVNSLRIMTMIDPDSGEAFIARAVQRIGTSRSFPVDNFVCGRGGLSAMVDPVTGRLGPGAARDHRWSVVRHDRHPETGAPIAGVEVPGWSGIAGRVLDYSRRFAYLPFIAWDVAVTEPSFTIIEANGGAGLTVLQVHGGLLAEPRIRRFYEHHGIVRGVRR